MFQYFKGFRTVESIKTEYRRLAMLHHPDHGGQTATMQEINSQYHAALKSVNGQTSQDADTGKEHTYRYNPKVEQAIMDKISQLISAGVAKSCEIFLIGTWVWITGDTKPIKDVLKTAGCIWHSKRLCWYWQNDGHSHRYNRNASLGSLAAKYGATQFQDREVGQLA
ncbi:MAG: hypothetical protein DDT21_01868 [Syntrophomonadaceae bacterium]|nr:hypothetical protein [Bacillota bacterium]